MNVNGCWHSGHLFLWLVLNHLYRQNTRNAMNRLAGPGPNLTKALTMMKPVACADLELRCPGCGTMQVHSPKPPSTVANVICACGQQYHVNYDWKTCGETEIMPVWTQVLNNDAEAKPQQRAATGA